jgi:hypothetical protein
LIKAFAVLLALLTAACTIERHDLAPTRTVGDADTPADTLPDMRLGTVCQAYERAAALARVDTLPETERTEHLRAASTCENVGFGPVDVPPAPR